MEGDIKTFDESRHHFLRDVQPVRMYYFDLELLLSQFLNIIELSCNITYCMVISMNIK